MPRGPLLFVLLAVGALAPASIQRPPGFSVGEHVLLTSGAVLSLQSTLFLAPPFLVGPDGQRVPAAPWFGRSLLVSGESAVTYELTGEQGRVWLPKRHLAQKGVFALARDGGTAALARKLRGQRVWPNGALSLPCELEDGLHAIVNVNSVIVADAWRVQARGVNISPRGGLIDGGVVLGGRLSNGPVFVAFKQPRGPRMAAATGGAELAALGEVDLLAAKRCRVLAGWYANEDDVRRNLTLTPPAKLPALPDDQHAAERALVGQTRAQILARYGSPNEEGSLAQILQARRWTYGEVTYNTVLLDFGPDGRVVEARLFRSP